MTNPATGEALSTLAVNMLRTNRDWEATPIDALLYLVIVGRGEDVKERLAERHGWNARDMAAIERMRAGLRPRGGEVVAYQSEKAAEVCARIDVGTWHGATTVSAGKGAL